MKAFVKEYLPVAPFITFVVMTFYLLSTWFFVGFLHYESQNRTLPVDSYRVEVVSVEDYAKLQDRSLKSVKLSNGTTIMDRQPAWYRTVLPNYQRVDDHFVHVTTVGTAHYYRRWLTDALPLMLLTAWGLFVTRWELRQRTLKPE